MKTLKFRKNLSELILQGKKTTTWRLFDDKNLVVGDIVSFLVWETKKEFAIAELIEVKEKKLGNLTSTDWDGHEKFKSDQEMYKTYFKYYQKDINKNTIVKIIKFKLKYGSKKTD